MNEPSLAGADSDLSALQEAAFELLNGQPGLWWYEPPTTVHRTREPVFPQALPAPHGCWPELVECWVWGPDGRALHAVATGAGTFRWRRFDAAPEGLEVGTVQQLSPGNLARFGLRAGGEGSRWQRKHNAALGYLWLGEEHSA